MYIIRIYAYLCIAVAHIERWVDREIDSIHKQYLVKIKYPIVHCTDPSLSMLGTFIIFLRCSLAYSSPNNRNLTYQKEAMFLKFPTAGRAFLKTSACKAGAASEQLQPHGRCCGMSLEWNPRWIWPMSRCLLYSQKRIYVVICSPEGLGVGYHQSLNQTLSQSFFGNRMLLKHQLGTAFFCFWLYYDSHPDMNSPCYSVYSSNQEHKYSRKNVERRYAGLKHMNLHSFDLQDIDSKRGMEDSKSLKDVGSVSPICK